MLWCMWLEYVGNVGLARTEATLEPGEAFLFALRSLGHCWDSGQTVGTLYQTASQG